MTFQKGDKNRHQETEWMTNDMSLCMHGSFGMGGAARARGCLGKCMAGSAAARGWKNEVPLFFQKSAMGVPGDPVGVKTGWKAVFSETAGGVLTDRS